MEKFISVLVIVGFLTGQITAQSTATNRSIAAQQIKSLKDGALIVRLKTNERSIEAYKKNGMTELANKLIAENTARNQKLLDAFRQFYDFSALYFIEAKNTAALLAGKQNIFLNDSLRIDTAIHLLIKNIFIVEYGTITTNERTDEYRYTGVYHTEPSSTSASTNVIFVSDTTLSQLREPFPFYQQTYLNNFGKAVANLNRNLHKAYFKLDDAAKNAVKNERKMLKEKLKKLQ